MPSSRFKIVHLLGGLGNQLWLAAYCHFLSVRGHSVILDISWYQKTSDYLFRSSRAKRIPYTNLLISIIPSIVVRCSIFSLLRLRFIAFCELLLPDSFLTLYLYRQDDRYVSDDFLIFLVNQLERWIPFSSQHKIFLSSTTALHLRLGDRGSFLNKHEYSVLRHKLSRLAENDSLLIFSDNINIAESIISSLSDVPFEVASEYVDDLSTLYAMSLCKSRLSIRDSSFFDWSEKISRFS